MPVTIIDRNEKIKWVYQGATFHYRRPPLQQKKKWINDSTNRNGITDNVAVLEKAVAWCLLGWDDGAVVDLEGKNIKFSDEAAQMLPEDWMIEFSEQLGLSTTEIDKIKDEEKN